uniref:Mitochondrial inner membrane protein OXA1L n=1 Tax=Cacopsylla melanoneura TaxID=428564 RepID=A0A8D8QTV7_9HEMI
MAALRCLYANSRLVLKSPHMSFSVKFESRCQYHHIKSHQTEVLASCLRRNKFQVSYAGISAARFLSTKQIDSVESQDENITQLYSKNIDKLSETIPVPPMDKSNIASPEIADISTSIPEAPMSKIAEILKELATEPPIEELGLGGWTPSGMVQKCLEFLHIDLDLPWWQAIIAATICVRLLTFPLTIMSQRNAIKMHNHMPEMQRLQVKMSEARTYGDNFEAARAGQELMEFMKKNDVNPLKNMLVPFLQMPVFISFFMGLRGMANVPVDSMREQGLWWFMDLTLPDQYYLLPIFTSATLYLTLHLGAEGAAMAGPAAKYTKYIVRGIPLVIFPFTLNFPGAILMYWSTTNFLSLIQVAVLKIPSVRTRFNLPERVKHKPAEAPAGGVKKKGFVTDLKESIQNSKITKEIAERNQLDEMQFNKAGRAALVKTYKFNPTLQRAKSTDTKSSGHQSLVKK